MDSLKVIALVGEPATGKSRIVRSLMERFLSPGEPFKGKLLFGTYHPREVLSVLGAYASGVKFPGTDRLSMAAQPEAEFWVRSLAKEKKKSVVFFEGDRLGNKKFLAHCSTVSTLRVFVLTATPETKAARHITRADLQSAKFLSGRQTKIANIREAFPEATLLENDSSEGFETCLSAIYSEIVAP